MFPPQNRAAMSTASDPPHMMSDTVASPERKSRTLQGPSVKEWARHRETIVELYRQFPLKKVSEIMKKQHGFSASKRMYDKRFREWNVFKHVNSDEKDRVVKRIHETTPTTGPVDRDSISQDDLRQTLRCAKTLPQGMRRATLTSPVSNPQAVDPASPHPFPAHSHRPVKRGLSISDLVRERPVTQRLVVSKTPSEFFPSPPATDVSCTTPTSTSSDELLLIPPINRCISTSPAPTLPTLQAQLHALACSPSPSISLDSKTRTLEIITLSLRNYFDWQLQNIPEGVLPDDYLGRRSSEQSTQYWDAIKNGIYLMKISDGSMEAPDRRPDRRAWPAFAEAGRLAAPAMKTQPFDFLREAFATLSPANTRIRPELRAVLLQFLASEARDKLSPTHPITTICRELQNDQDCQEVSRRGLQCMLDLFNSRLGRSRAVTFKLLDSLATMLRRNGELDAAMDIIMELLNSCRQVFGHGSDQVRTVESELAHFYMVADECDLALGHCMAVVKRPPKMPGPLPDPEPVFYQDAIAAHAMEDIAEIHQRRGDIGQCITWLERAASIALSIWGPQSIATGHIVDKMTNLQREFGTDLLRSAMRWQAAVD
ncbi:hypothetical protein QBC46DRAFT_374365 [Diplogelasinospora grovesii]|uniref:Clr5 domain-containing protein n=1 Tax=Diplogelasinospora grovesii TaxID=303347 RepID=A0AAN6NIT4_9PEZI|nr:hypothetical protein QBC46DRAFT_374365 [Diplogelasinospora grovesii]